MRKSVRSCHTCRRWRSSLTVLELCLFQSGTTIVRVASTIPSTSSPRSGFNRPRRCSVLESWQTAKLVRTSLGHCQRSPLGKGFGMRSLTVRRRPPTIRTGLAAGRALELLASRSPPHMMDAVTWSKAWSQRLVYVVLVANCRMTDLFPRAMRLCCAPHKLAADLRAARGDQDLLMQQASCGAEELRQVDRPASFFSCPFLKNHHHRRSFCAGRSGTWEANASVPASCPRPICLAPPDSFRFLWLASDIISLPCDGDS